MHSHDGSSLEEPWLCTGGSMQLRLTGVGGGLRFHSFWDSMSQGFWDTE